MLMSAEIRIRKSFETLFSTSNSMSQVLSRQSKGLAYLNVISGRQTACVLNETNHG